MYSQNVSEENMKINSEKTQYKELPAIELKSNTKDSAKLDKNNSTYY